MASVLLVPGWAHAPESLAPLLSAEPARSAHAVGVSLPPRHRRAAGERNGGSPGVSRYAEALASQAAEVDPPVLLVAWSMGALVALEALAGGLSAGVEGAVLLAPTARFCSTKGYPCGVPERRLRAMRGRIERHPRAVLGEFLREVAAPEVPAGREIDPLVETAVLGGIETLTDGLDYLHGTDVRAVLDRVRVPVLVMHGREDRIIPPEAGRRVAEAIEGARWTEVAGGGHDLSGASVAPRVAKAIAEFAAERGGGA